MPEPGLPAIDVALLGNYDAMVVIRTKDAELAFLMKREMSEDDFRASCEALRRAVLQ